MDTRLRSATSRPHLHSPALAPGASVRQAVSPDLLSKSRAPGPNGVQVSSLLRMSLILLISICLALASACSPASRPSPFIPPTARAPFIEPTLIMQPTEPVLEQNTPLPTIALPTATSNPEDCVSNLTFLSDLTIFDGTSIPYGASIDKQWLVQNSGTCNWNAGYRLRYIGGALLGAQEELNLYPAKSGTQAVIQITFTAPFTDGVYESAWQAFDPFGLAFGDSIYLRIVVVPP